MSGSNTTSLFTEVTFWKPRLSYGLTSPAGKVSPKRDVGGPPGICGNLSHGDGNQSNRLCTRVTAIDVMIGIKKAPEANASEAF